MVYHAHPPRRTRTSQIVGAILLIASVGFAAASVWVWLTADAPGSGTPPTAQTNKEVHLAQVLSVLRDADERWDYGRTSVRTDQLPIPGQHLTLAEHDLYVFIFSGESDAERVAARERASAKVDLPTMTLTASGQPVTQPGQRIYLVHHSNVMAILIGGDRALAEDIGTALARLP